MKKALFLCIFFISALNAQYINRLPTTLTLKAGENKTEDAIADCTSPWECIFNADRNSNGYSFTYNTTGATTSTLTLNAKLPPNPQSKNTNIPFYASTLTVNKNSTLVLNGFESLSIQNALNINGGSLRYSHTTATSGFGLPTNARVTLSNNALFEINAGKFTNNGTITLSNQSTLNINTEGGNKTNNYGSITNNNSNITVKNDLWNLGQKPALGAASPSSVASLINNGGTITIGGNLYNGGQNFSNNVQFCQIGFCGGGNVIINGGTVSVGGKLISEGKDGQNSSIQIKGGTLKVTGGLENKQGSTLTFGIGSNNEMGKLQGNLSNENGATINVDMTKTQAGKTYRVLQGTLSGANQNVNFINNANPQFITASYKDGIVSIFQTGTTPPNPNPNPDPNPTPQPPSKFETYKNNLPSNKKGILNALSSKFGGDDTLLTSVKNIETAIATTDKAIKESFVAQPQTMISALQSNALPLPVPKRALVSRRTAASEIIRFDNGKRVSPFAKKVVRAPKNRNFYFNPLGAILRAENLTGYIAGFTLGTSYEIRNYTSQVYFAYAYGASSQDFDTQNTDTTGNLFQFGFLHRYSYGILELEANANLLAGVFELKNEWAQTPQLNSTANFGDYQVNLGFIVGAKLGKRLSFKPFAGIQNYFELRDDFKQKGGLQIKGEGYNAYIVDGVLGIEGRYIFDELASIFGKFSFEERLLNTHKEMLMWAFGNELKYDNESYKNALSVSVGTQILTWYDFNLDAELSYKHYNNGLNYFGGSLMFKYAF